MDRRDSEHSGRPGVRSFADWMFRSRETSRIVVAQVPNALLLVWLAATVVRWAVQPDGAWRCWAAAPEEGPAAAETLTKGTGDEGVRARQAGDPVEPVSVGFQGP